MPCHAVPQVCLAVVVQFVVMRPPGIAAKPRPVQAGEAWAGRLFYGAHRRE